MAFRNFLKHRLFSAINIFGLAFGLASCLLILLFVQHELSYDKWIPDSDNIYRVHSQFVLPGRPPLDAVLAPGPVHGAVLRDMPEVEEAARLLNRRQVIRIGDKSFSESVWYGEESFLKIFELPFVVGNPETALASNNNIVISEAMAEKYFGQTSPLDQTLNFNDEKDYKVVGVFKDLPENTHFDIEFMVKLDPEDSSFQQGLENWFSINGYLYLKLKEGVDPQMIEDRFPSMISDNATDLNMGGTILKAEDLMTLRVEKLTNLHLHPFGVGNMKTPGNINTVYSFSAIALLILVIACINFMNLSTARSTQRAREVALRKVVGASRKQLIIQFLSEAVLMTVFALFFALAITEIFLPWYNEFTDKQLTLNYLTDPTLFVSLFSLVIIVGMIGGLYPAFYISSFKPAAILKANQSSQASGSGKLRSALVILQFSISIALVICTAVVYGQIQFAETMDRGFSKENKLILRGVNRDFAKDNKLAIAEEIKRLPAVEGVSFSSSVPADIDENNTIVRIPGQQTTEPILIGQMVMDYDYLDIYEMDLLAGRGFSRDRGQDELIVPDDREIPLTRASIIINEGAMRRLGFTSPEQALGEIIMYGVRQGANSFNEMEIIGVIPDINFRSLKDDMRAIIYTNQQSGYNNLTIHYREGTDPQKLVQDVESVWKKFVPDAPARHQFLDENIARQYADDQKRGKMFAAFAGLAIIIACLGLYGLAAFTAAMRTKEIGIRKVMGATKFDIVKMLVWQFSKPVIIANLIAWPVAYYLMEDYLKGFQYRIDLGASYFIIAGGLALIIAWATVTHHALKVAAAKPINALRYE